MPDNHQDQNNAVSFSPNAPVDNIEEGMWRMKIEKKGSKEEGERKGQSNSSQYPDRPGEPDCIHYLRTGFCGYGSNCRFNHPPTLVKTTQNRSELPQREGQPDCGYYLKTGACKYGLTCKYHHPLDRRGAGQVPLNTLGLPMRQEEKPCPYYMRTYTCKFGPACKFNHPQPSSVEANLPVSGPAAVGSIGSNLPPTGIAYVGAIPAWPLTRSSYIASSRVPGTTPYVPLVFPPLQGPVATQSWNSYMGSLSPVYASNMMRTNLVYNSGHHQGEMVTNGHVDLLTMTTSYLPERPDQPDCRYFMTTGSCKYGSICKFHHPKERIAHLASSNLGPHGLPLRPGEDICAYFSSYGICKYGPTCKYDHPFAGYLSSYYLGMPSIPMHDYQPFFPAQKNPAMSNSSETSPSKSLKITDWIQKPETVEIKNPQNSEAKAVEDTHEQPPPGVDDHQKAAPSCSESDHDQSG